MALASQRLRRPVTYGNASLEHAARDADWHDDSVARFADRFSGRLQLAGRDVLDVGCGTGALGAEAAARGAARVVGVDLHPMEAVRRRERRRFRSGEHARRNSDVRGGLHRMTLARFRAIMHRTGLELTNFATNMGSGRGPRVARAAGRAPALRELFAVSVSSIWSRPA